MGITQKKKQMRKTLEIPLWNIMYNVNVNVECINNINVVWDIMIPMYIYIYIMYHFSMESKMIEWDIVGFNGMNTLW